MQVLEDLGLDFILLSDLIHTPLDRLVFIVDLVLEDFPLCLEICKFQVDLLKDIKLSVSLEDCLFKILNLCICLFLLLTQLIDIILVVDQAINDRVNQLLYQMPGLGLDIEPQKFERWVVSGQAFEVARDKTLVLKLFLPIRDFGCCTALT